MDKIIYNRIEYPIREVYIKTFGAVTISINSLNDSLMNKDGSYKNDEAKFIDEQIFFFVEKINLDEISLSREIQNCL